MILSKAVIEKEINKVWKITDASIYKGREGYCFASKTLGTHLWQNVNLYISTIVDSSLDEFILGVDVLALNEGIFKPKKSEDPHGIKNSVDLKITPVKRLSDYTDDELRKELESREEVYVLIVPANREFSTSKLAYGAYNTNIDDLLVTCNNKDSTAYKLGLKCYKTKRGDL